MRRKCRANQPDGDIQALDINDAGEIVGTTPGCLCDLTQDGSYLCGNYSLAVVKWKVTRGADNR